MPTTLQCMMDQLLNDLSEFASVYTDDVAIFRATWDEHTFWGCTYILPTQAKNAAVMNFPCPKMKTDVRSFIGIATYYKDFVPIQFHYRHSYRFTQRGPARKGFLWYRLSKCI